MEFSKFSDSKGLILWILTLGFNYTIKFKNLEDINGNNNNYNVIIIILEKFF